MDPQQTNPTPVETLPKQSHKIFYILIFIFIALVGSSAYLFIQNSKKEVSQSVPVQNGVEEWKTYRNEDYGFEFKYPNDWNLDPSYTEFLVLDWNENPAVIMQPSDDIKFCSINVNLFDQKYQNLADEVKKYPLTNISEYITVNGHPGFRGVSSYNEKYDFVYIKSTDKKSVSIALRSGRDVNAKCLEVLNKILADFKFIDGPDLSGWKTYKNEEYGFEFKHPTGFSVVQIESNGVEGFYLEIGIELDSITILPKGEFDYGLDSQPGRIRGVVIGDKNAEEKIWYPYDRPVKKLRIISIKDQVFGWSADNRIEIRGSNDEVLLNRVLSTFKFTK